MAVLTRTFHAKGTHCRGCEAAIESAVTELAGIRTVRASYAKETVAVEVTWDAVTHHTAREVGAR